MFRIWICAALLAGATGSVSACLVEDFDDVPGSDDPGGKADRIDPEGEEQMGYLLLSSPVSTRGLYNAQITYGAKSITLDEAARVDDGTGCVRLRGSYVGGTACEVTVTVGETTEVPLSGLYIPGQTELGEGVDLGPRPHVTITTAEDGHATANSWPATVARDQLILPGDYDVDFHLPGIDSVTVSIDPGVVTDVGLPVEPAVVRVLPPIARDFPDPANPTGSCANAAHHWIVERDNREKPEFREPHPSVERWYGVVSAVDFDVAGGADDAAMFSLPVDAGSHYELVVSNVGVRLDLEPGETREIQLERIDVNDVRVTREDGTTYMVAGNWIIERQGPTPDRWVRVGIPSLKHGSPCYYNEPRSYPTRTGMDLPPGTYRVTITYFTEEGRQSQQHVLELGS